MPNLKLFLHVNNLLPTLGGSAMLIVPQAMLHTFATATPRPQAIYYTAVANNYETSRQSTF